MLNANKPFSLHLNPDLFRPATEEEKAYISRMRPSSTFFRDGCKRLLKNKVATCSLILIILILAVFLLMTGALVMGKNDLFFLAGSVLVAMLILGWVLLRARKAAIERQEKEEEGTWKRRVKSHFSLLANCGKCCKKRKNE